MTLVESLARFAFKHPTTLEDLNEFYLRVKTLTDGIVDVYRVGTDEIRLEIKLGNNTIVKRYPIT